jgi:predicted outer membrane repeat protein
MFSFTKSRLSGKTLFLIFTACILSSALYSTIINVPADQPTIQAAINTSVDADTVLVQPGTYMENIVFGGKLVTVGSLFLTTHDPAYIASTIIDGGNLAGVVYFANGENSSAFLSGFTITNGYAHLFTNLDGGGIYCSQSSPCLKNLIITGNSAEEKGGGIYCENNSSPSLTNVTISDNSANEGDGIWSFEYSTPNIINSIIWDEIASDWTGFPIISYSDILCGWTGTGNISSDPLFVDPANGDYSLQSTSPCIDAGDPTSPLDPDGTIADMGAWFYDQGSDVDDNEIKNVKFNLSNYPNPFNPVTTIKFDIKEYEIGVLTIFNIKGQLIDSHQFEAGQHNFQWDAENCSSGVYLYKLQTESFTEIRKMILLK